MDLPVPKDIPLPQPAPDLLLEILIIVSFLLHILFVALMVGGSVLAAGLEISGRWRREHDGLARWVASTVTVNKSLAVVLGVAPLLIINTYYTPYFYAANALTGTAWISVIPLVIAAFLLTYAHKYGWDLLENRKGLRLSLSIAASALFLFIPLIFLTNINLMLYPEQWREVRGFLSALALPNVLPRYLHFLAASVAVTSLFLAWYAGRDSFNAREGETISTGAARRMFYSIALVTTSAQLFFGPLLYFTLPAHTVSWGMTFVIIAGAALAIFLMWLLYREVLAPEENTGRLLWPILATLSAVVILMGTGRHMVRETAVDPHRHMVQERTARYTESVSAAGDFVLIPGGLGAGDIPEGEAVFRRVCAACHAREQRLVGPPLTEISTVYAGDPDGIVTWSLNPGRKRTDYPAMPAQNLPEAQIRAVADYILNSD